jgi:hypothetical protein
MSVVRRPARAEQRDLLWHAGIISSGSFAAQQSVAVEGAAEISEQPPRRFALDPLGDSKRRMVARFQPVGCIAFRCARSRCGDRRIGKTDGNGS